MTIDANELAHDLEQAIEGEVRFTNGDRALYATGGSNYRQLPIGVSIACGERVLLPKVRQAPPETTLVSDGFSCQSQIEQASRTGRRALHDAQVIALARECAPDAPGRYPERAAAPPPRPTALAGFTAVGVRTLRS